MRVNMIVSMILYLIGVIWCGYMAYCSSLYYKIRYKDEKGVHAVNIITWLVLFGICTYRFVKYVVIF